MFRSHRAVRCVWIGWIGLLLLCSLTGCLRKQNSEERPRTILVWHDWPEPQSAALEELLRGFEEVYPHITVVVDYVPKEEMQDAYIDQAAAGLGPDLLIESDLATVANLCEADLLMDLSNENLNTEELLPHAVNALRNQDGLFGIPFAAHTNVLYFNKTLIDSPPKSIDNLRSLWPIEEVRKPSPIITPDNSFPDDPLVEEAEETVLLDSASESDDTDLLATDDAAPADDAEQADVVAHADDAATEDVAEETPKKSIDQPPAEESVEAAKERVVAQIGSFVGRNDGRQVALTTDFFHAFWGIRAFDGHAFNEHGQLTIDNGFVKWLEWLLQIQQDPAIILDNNYDDLMEAFGSGRTALMIGDSAEFVELQRKLGFENLGVSTLPSGAVPAGGLLQLEVISVSKLTSHRDICCHVIRYLCNDVSQRKIALSEVGQIPVHRRIRFDARLMPVAATLKKQIQSTSTMSLTNVRFQERMFEIGNDVYLSVLAGELEPEEAVERVKEALEQQQAESEAAN